jgi:hypothetical protein
VDLGFLECFLINIIKGKGIFIMSFVVYVDGNTAAIVTISAPSVIAWFAYSVKVF